MTNLTLFKFEKEWERKLFYLFDPIDKYYFNRFNCKKSDPERKRQERKFKKNISKIIKDHGLAFLDKEFSSFGTTYYQVVKDRIIRCPSTIEELNLMYYDGGIITKIKNTGKDFPLHSFAEINHESKDHSLLVCNIPSKPIYEFVTTLFRFNSNKDRKNSLEKYKSLVKEVQKKSNTPVSHWGLCY